MRRLVDVGGARYLEGFGDASHDDGDDEGFGGGGGGVSARVSFLANVAAAVADDFLARLRRRASAGDAFGTLAVGSGRDGAVRVGACIAGASFLSRCLAEHGRVKGGGEGDDWLGFGGGIDPWAPLYSCLGRIQLSSLFSVRAMALTAGTSTAPVDDLTVGTIYKGIFRVKVKVEDETQKRNVIKLFFFFFKFAAILCHPSNIFLPLRDGEDAALLEIGAALFEEQCAALDAFASEWIAALADAAFGAFSSAAAHYTGGAHLLTFADNHAEEDQHRHNRTSSSAAAAAAAAGVEAAAGVAAGRNVEKDAAVDARGLGAEAYASRLLASPLAVLRERLHGLRAALYSPEDRSPFNAAVRQLAAAVSAHVLGEVATQAAFSDVGARRLAADVRAVAATLR